MDRSAGYTTITPGPIHLLLRRDRRPEDLDKTPAGPGFASLSPRRLACGKNNVGNSLSIFRVCIGDFSLLGFRHLDALPISACSASAKPRREGWRGERPRS